MSARWQERYIAVALTMLITWVVAELLGRQLRPWPPVANVRVELLETTVPRGGQLPAHVSYQMTRSGCWLTVRREVRSLDGVWHVMAEIDEAAPRVGSQDYVTTVPLDPEWDLGVYYYRAVASLDCPASELFGGRQYHPVLRGPYAFRIVEEME